MPDNSFETFDVNGLTVTFSYDVYPQNPRDDSTNYSTIATWQSNYASPDKLENLPYVLNEAVARWLPDSRSHFTGVEAAKVLRYARAFHSASVLAIVALQVNRQDGSLKIIEHPNAVSRNGAYAYYDGIAMISRSQWVSAMGDDYDGDMTPLTIIEQEVAAYNAYCQGDVYAFTIQDEDGGLVEGVGGYYSIDEMRRDAASIALARNPERTKVVTVETVCTATVKETWTYRVPESWTPDDADDRPEVIDELDSYGALTGVTNEVSDERDREIISINIAGTTIQGELKS